MQIPPGVDAARWQALNLDDPACGDWPETIRICETRTHERFINSVDRLARPIGALNTDEVDRVDSGVR